ncbi:MAG: hypothetical protein V3U26_00890 [Dehalococcoidia bacterium]
MESQPQASPEGLDRQGPSSASQDNERHIIGRLKSLRSQQRSLEDELIEIQARQLGFHDKVNGAAIAAILSASVGVFVIGLLTTLAAASGGVKSWLDWYSPTGPLSGKTTLGGIVWLVMWLGTHYLFRDREVDFKRFVQLSVVILAIGLLLMFPPIFELFE